jgi:hypothetical protein
MHRARTDGQENTPRRGANPPDLPGLPPTIPTPRLERARDRRHRAPVLGGQPFHLAVRHCGDDDGLLDSVLALLVATTRAGEAPSVLRFPPAPDAPPTVEPGAAPVFCYLLNGRMAFVFRGMSRLLPGSGAVRHLCS